MKYDFKEKGKVKISGEWYLIDVVHDDFVQLDAFATAIDKDDLTVWIGEDGYQPPEEEVEFLDGNDIREFRKQNNVDWDLDASCLNKLLNKKLKEGTLKLPEKGIKVWQKGVDDPEEDPKVMQNYYNCFIWDGEAWEYYEDCQNLSDCEYYILQSDLPKPTLEK